MRTLEEARLRWRASLSPLGSADDEPSLLRARIGASLSSSPDTNPCVIGLRSVCWKILLYFKQAPQSAWPGLLHRSRQRYKCLQQEHTRRLAYGDEHDPDLIDTTTILAAYQNTIQQDEELRADIFQDVERCMPEYAIFRDPQTQQHLLEILYIYCKCNPEIGYRQGMHEVLAPVLWVVYCDAISPESNTADTTSTTDDQTMSVILGAEYIEHDAFGIFDQIMSSVKSFYHLPTTSLTATSAPVDQGIIPIVDRSRRIHETCLHQADPELAEHLTAIEVLPQIFLIRWIRLLFGREFPFDQVLELWDGFFALDPHLDLVDLVAVAMLLRVRWQLLESDYTAALTLLLRYPSPSPHRPTSFFADALYLRDNPDQDAGNRIIEKYSHRTPETTVTRKLPKKIRRARTIPAPGVLESAVLPTQLEGLLHGAAKEVLSRGERWGVTGARALRGAVAGLALPLPVVSVSPRRVGEDRSEGCKETELLKRFELLEERNRALADMLESVVKDLKLCDSQSNEETQTTGGEAVAALSVAVAKVEFVQVYLRDSSISLSSNARAEDVTGANDNNQAQTTPRETHGNTKHITAKTTPNRIEAEALDDELKVVDMPTPTRVRRARGEARMEGQQDNQRQQMNGLDEKGGQKDGSLQGNGRARLADSSYSWMLGGRNEAVGTPELLFGRRIKENVRDGGRDGGQDGHLVTDGDVFGRRMS